MASAFLNFPIDEKSQNLLGFEFQGSFYQYLVMPFGVSAAPEICQSMLQVPVLKNRTGPNQVDWKIILHFLDDFMDEIKKGNKKGRRLLEDLLEHNLRIKEEKSQYGSLVVYLGFEIDFHRCVLACQNA